MSTHYCGNLILLINWTNLVFGGLVLVLTSSLPRGCLLMCSPSCVRHASEVDRSLFAQKGLVIRIFRRSFIERYPIDKSNIKSFT